ncbi:MAG: helix-turn-helix transcriptional regulator [Candidatus Cloacimonetes bacterium]|nr:helix-turn-helix transcriptional regulator [Candidatus Cloacimonadota bacterium]
MKKFDKVRYQAMAAVSKALAHPTRLYIVENLKEKSCSVGELTDMIGDDISTVSKHLHILKQNGIVTDQKQGNQVFYKLLCPCVLNIFNCVLDVIQTNTTTSLNLLSRTGRNIR